MKAPHTATLIMVMLSLLSNLYATPTVAVPETCETLYFINAIKVYNSTINETLMLETPQNITLVEGFYQNSSAIYVYNLEFNETAGYFTFKVAMNQSFFGFFVSEVTVCHPEGSALLDYYSKALGDPSYTPVPNSTMPHELVEKYVRKPYAKVTNVVVPAFEEWFNETHGVPASSASVFGLAVNAAFFTYRYYFTYNASDLPRTIDEVVDSRQGDCDDMSRVLVELLSYYGIPAVIASGYVYIRDIGVNGVLSTKIGNVTYVFKHNGPHAFVLAYIPGLGWISLDFLAGSLLDYSFVFEGYTRETYVNETEVGEVVDLHREITAVQVFSIMERNEYLSMFSGPDFTLPARMEAFIESLAGGPGGKPTSPTTTPTTTTMTTPYTTTGIQSQPAQTTSGAATSGGMHVDGRLPVILVVLAVAVFTLLVAIWLSRRRLTSSVSSPP
ncbi:transglutaminase-like domain-containing protein [Desulfurococcus mucosus]|uniref:Transglutaminase domain-containing protein n=1 Tax=Desulfurococcus mucosus (strain ATCC 35584 / DSM 2162 / JCM 9187 / O7/1) TaxID=765177 RepID=E8R964_DESM0|nr:transglutaminase-like domain-containing protein [Desulfurococcus mucosus]ADV65040.1 transglutaminase domain-containing protein [Desulfurococcus mucosus DSM 2162]